MKKHLLILLLLTPALAWSQTIADYWYFGEYCGMHFTGDEPEVLTNGELVTWEGCSTISDEEGNLLFYTNGVKIWNMEHEIMPDGINLYGNISSTMSGLIVPHPGNSDQYFVFTVDAVENHLAKGLCFSIVDMNLDNGLGDVVPGYKNIEVLYGACEKITAVKHANGMDYWVITSKFGTNQIYAYRITVDGFDAENPVISTGGMVTVEEIQAAGNMKVSPDGTLLAKSNVLGTLELFYFDDASGELSFFLSDSVYTYGIAFASNSKVLYATKDHGLLKGEILQYNLASGNPQEILDSRISLIYTEEYGITGLQLAPDFKIYATGTMREYIDRINYPHIIGAGCNYVKDVIFLEGGLAHIGLPQLPQSIYYINSDFTYQGVCVGELTYFQQDCSREPDSVFWDFGDPASGSLNTSKLFNPSHMFTSSGIFQVKLTAFFRDTTDAVSKFISIHESPEIDLGNDTSLCNGNSIVLDPGSGFASYLWQNGEITQTLQADTSGLYWVEVETPDGCAARDSIMIQFNQNYLISHDTSICFGDSVYLQDEWQKESGVYSDSMITVYGCDSILQTNLAVRDTFLVYQQIEICEGDSVFLQGEWRTQTGTYTDIFQSQLACDSTVVTGLTVSAVIHTNMESSICMGDSIFLQGDYRHEAGIYYDTAQSAFGCDSITITELFVNMVYDILQDTGICACDSILLGGEYRQEEGVYYDAFQTIYGCDSLITTSLEVHPIPEVNLGHDTLLQQGETLLLDAFFPGAEYLWQDGSDNPQYYVDIPGTYHVLVSNLCGFASDTIVVEYDDENGGAVECELRMPNAFTPNGDGLNDVFLPVMECEPFQYNLWIYDRWGKQIFHTDNPLQAWNGSAGGKAVPAGAYAFVLEYSSRSGDEFTRQLKGTVLVLR